MTEPSHAFEDLVSGLRPHKRLRMPVGELDVSTDGRLQLAGAAMDAAAQLFLGQRRKPALDEGDPGSPRGREVQGKARVSSQPAMNRGCFVGTGVVEDQVPGQRWSTRVSMVARNLRNSRARCRR
jgi:hypothetical protein